MQAQTRAERCGEVLATASHDQGIQQMVVENEMHKREEIWWQ